MGSVRQVAERAADRVRACVADHGQDGAASHSVLTAGADRNCSAIDCDAIGNHEIGAHPVLVAFEGVGVSRIRIKGDWALDYKSELLVRPNARSKKGSRPAPGANCDRARNDSTPTQSAGIDVKGPGSGA